MNTATDQDDAALLALYVDCRKSPAGRAALGEIVRRNVDFVFGVARRTVRDPVMAEDVTQAVFLILARKADTIADPQRLGSWLFKTTQYTSLNAVKLAARRSYHERHAARSEDAHFEDSPMNADDLSENLNQALSILPAMERDVILLRFFRGEDYPQIARRLGVSEPAARKRLSRGIERMRLQLGKRQAVVSTIAVALTMTSAASERASAAVMDRVVTSAVAGKGSANALALVEIVTTKQTAMLAGSLLIVLLALGAGFGSRAVLNHGWQSAAPVNDAHVAFVAGNH